MRMPELEYLPHSSATPPLPHANHCHETSSQRSFQHGRCGNHPLSSALQHSFPVPWPMVSTSHRGPCRASRTSSRSIVFRAPTVRRALHLLEQEGRITRRRGSGTYAKTSRVHSSLAFNAEALYGGRAGRREGAGNGNSPALAGRCARRPAGRASGARREGLRGPAHALG